MEHREIKTPEQIAEMKKRSPGGYRNLRESVINELFRTPSVTDSTGGAISEIQARERGRMVKTADQVAQLAAENGLQVSPAIAASLLPTPTTQDGKNNAGPSQFERNTLPLNAEVMLMGTPRATAANSSAVEVDAQAPKARLEDQVLVTSWGKFESAIRRWEEVLGRPAPAPTKPDGKDGNHRLSSKFTEWMMGLPDGWITGHDLKRNDELKLAGNGVVPAQAELALRLLLELPGEKET